MAGLDDKFIYLQDPEIGKIRKLNKEDFLTVWFDFKGKYIKPNKLIIRQIIAIYKMKKNKKYFLNFIEETVLNPKYSDYIGGRIEVRDDDHSYSVEEIRFITNKIDEWREFRNKWDFKEVNKSQIGEIKKIVRSKYFEF